MLSALGICRKRWGAAGLQAKLYLEVLELRRPKDPRSFMHPRRLGNSSSEKGSESAQVPVSDSDRSNQNTLLSGKRQGMPSS